MTSLCTAEVQGIGMLHLTQACLSCKAVDHIALSSCMKVFIKLHRLVQVQDCIGLVVGNAEATFGTEAPFLV